MIDATALWSNTGNLYAHVLMGLKRQAASQMDSALGTLEGAQDDEPDDRQRLVAPAESGP